MTTLRGLMWLFNFPWSFSLPWCSWATRCYCSSVLTFDFSNDSSPDCGSMTIYSSLTLCLHSCWLELSSPCTSRVIPCLLLPAVIPSSLHNLEASSSLEAPAETLQAHGGVLRSMVKSRISHSKSCSCGRRELLQKSLNNHVFPLIYSKYLRREQIKAGKSEANADEAAEGWALLREHFCPNQGETILLQLPA